MPPWNVQSGFFQAALEGAKADVHCLGELRFCFGFCGNVVGSVVHNDVGKMKVY